MGNGNSTEFLSEDIFSRDAFLFRISSSSGDIDTLLRKTSEEIHKPVFNSETINTTLRNILDSRYYNVKLKTNNQMEKYISYFFKNNINETIKFLINYQQNDNYIDLHNLKESNTLYQNKQNLFTEARSNLKDSRNVIYKDLRKLSSSFNDKQNDQYQNLYIQIVPDDQTFMISIYSFTEHEVSESDILLEDLSISNLQTVDTDETYRVEGFQAICMFLRVITEDQSIHNFEIEQNEKYFSSIIEKINTVYSDYEHLIELREDEKNYLSETFQEILNLNVPNIYQAINQIISDFNVQFKYLENLYVKLIYYQIDFLAHQLNDKNNTNNLFNIKTLVKFIDSDRKKVLQDLRLFINSQQKFEKAIHNKKGDSVITNLLNNVSSINYLEKEISKMYETMSSELTDIGVDM